MSEIWLPAPGWRNYEVSSAGRVRRSAPGGRFGLCHIMATFKHSNGYLSVCLSQDGKATGVHIHRLVCEAFHGPKPTPKHHAAHYDGDTTNNFQSNLRWATCKENSADKKRHGTQLYGERHPNAVLTNETVRKIKYDLSTGQFLQKQIARKYAVKKETVSQISRGIIWKEVTL